jgi:hypothetical protein
MEPEIQPAAPELEGESPVTGEHGDDVWDADGHVYYGNVLLDDEETVVQGDHTSPH